jgi:hypothetical protein
VIQSVFKMPPATYSNRYAVCKTAFGQVQILFETRDEGQSVTLDGYRLDDWDLIPGKTNLSFMSTPGPNLRFIAEGKAVGPCSCQLASL